MILNLTTCGISQVQACDLLRDLEYVQESLVNAMHPSPKLSTDERMALLHKLRTTAAQCHNVANNITLNHYAKQANISSPPTKKKSSKT